jgi:magnesium transporter
VIVDCAVYRDGVRRKMTCAPTDLTAVRQLAEPGDFVWVGLHRPSQTELEDVAVAFSLHPLAVEDAVKAHQRPKLDVYEDSLFLTVKTLWYVDEDDAVETGEVNMFIGSDFVITVRHGEGSELASARSWLESQRSVLAHGPSAVAYAVCDRVVDGYEAVGAALAVDVDEVEESVFSTDRTSDAARIYVLKREIAEMRRAVAPLRDPIRRFAEGTVPVLADEASPYFRDVGDHLSRAAETTDALDSLLSTAFEAHLAQISVQQNEDMRKISAGAALVVVPTLIAGVYGMNFPLTPSNQSTYGFWYALALMGLSTVVLMWFFKRAKWL